VQYKTDLGEEEILGDLEEGDGLSSETGKILQWPQTLQCSKRNILKSEINETGRQISLHTCIV
jgi:hypothetical protein